MVVSMPKAMQVKRNNLFFKCLLAVVSIAISGCTSSGEPKTREEACFIYGNAHQIFHEIYLTESDSYVQSYLDKERDNSEDFAKILEIRSEQFKNFSPIEVNMILTHACVKKYHLNTYNFIALRQCMDKEEMNAKYNCVDKSLKLSHLEQNTKV